MAKRKRSYVCGKCGDRFGSPKDLRTHVKEEHKVRPRGGRGRAPKFEGQCGKCGRTEFKNRSSFSQHCRFCKGPKIKTAMVTPIPPERALPFAGPSLLQTMAKKTAENGNIPEQLKAEAAALRKRSDEILEYVKSFEAGAAKFLTK